MGHFWILVNQCIIASAADQDQAGLHPQYHALTNGSHDEIVNIMQRQNDIAALLAQQNLSSVLIII